MIIVWLSARSLLLQFVTRGRNRVVNYVFFNCFSLFSAEEENYVQVKPGRQEDNFRVKIKVQIFDIFQDYAECIRNLGQVKFRYYVHYE